MLKGHTWAIMDAWQAIGRRQWTHYLGLFPWVEGVSKNGLSEAVKIAMAILNGIFKSTVLKIDTIRDG